jgi:hypothetical protein
MVGYRCLKFESIGEPIIGNPVHFYVNGSYVGTAPIEAGGIVNFPLDLSAGDRLRLHICIDEKEPPEPERS